MTFSYFCCEEVAYVRLSDINNNILGLTEQVITTMAFSSIKSAVSVAFSALCCDVIPTEGTRLNSPVSLLMIKFLSVTCMGSFYKKLFFGLTSFDVFGFI